eukprot:CAMPEP_0183426794 /NCGR_PEP_ID=MMETSP0370-20130417/39903_1 /TAXON_ID=268820 /ORGANISM="Peridinium aciculiferum, Strain PAER-2" /LENGTH=63 /DNA_ID=CAMNT_0025611253 /DNA_START=73 /DNA_END=260 /DNA_ORIENTATION=-
MVERLQHQVQQDSLAPHPRRSPHKPGGEEESEGPRLRRLWQAHHRGPGPPPPGVPPPQEARAP